MEEMPGARDGESAHSFLDLSEAPCARQPGCSLTPWPFGCSWKKLQ